MKQFIIKVALLVIRLLMVLVPVKKNQIVFYSAFDFNDNARGIYEYLKQSNEGKNYQMIWLVSNPKKYMQIDEPAIFYRHKSICGVWSFLRSKIIVRTHSLFGNLYNPKKQVLINAFHGMPIKSFLSAGVKNKNFDNFCILPTTAEVFSEIISNCFSMNKERFPVLGMARNDFLYDQTDILEKMGLKKFDKVMLWMPTFRTSAIGNFYDGKQSVMGLPCLNRSDLKTLNQTLRENDILLVLKLHPWASNSIGDLSEYSNICNVSNNDIPYPYTLYHFVAQADVLITDFSSIYIDYLLVNKPVAFIIDDYYEYKNSRGFAFEPIENYLAGKIITDFEGFIDYINNMEKINNEYVDKRHEICNVFHAHQDGLSAKRTVEYIMNRMKND